MRLPAIHLIEAFEAVARLKNLTKAAEALFITVSAVSQRITSLEEQLSVQLFTRNREGLELTIEGERYQAAIDGVLERIAQASENVGMPNHVEQSVRVLAASGFVRYWLLPRIGQFRKDFPKTQLSIVSSVDAPNFKTDPVDIWIRRGHYSSDTLEVECLTPESFIPLCSPAYAKANPVNSTAEITSLDLLRCHRKNPTWVDWYTKEGLPSPSMSRLMVFANAADALDAAVHGVGVVLESNELTSGAIADGLLVALLPNAEALLGAGYRVIYPKNRLANEGTKNFRDWLFSEIARAKKH